MHSLRLDRLQCRQMKGGEYLDRGNIRALRRFRLVPDFFGHRCNIRHKNAGENRGINH